MARFWHYYDGGRSARESIRFETEFLTGNDLSCSDCTFDFRSGDALYLGHGGEGLFGGDGFVQFSSGNNASNRTHSEHLPKLLA